MTLPRTTAEINAFLEARGLAPLSRFGQNFLIQPASLSAVADAAGELDLVLEIGPGLGALTSELLHRGAQVVAAEIDSGYCAALREELREETRFSVMEGDCLADGRLAPAVMAALSAAGVAERGFKIVANLPYQISSPFLAAVPHMLVRPAVLVLMLQKEVARALRAQPGTEHYTPLSLLAKLCYRVEQIRTVPAAHFYPQPEVESAIVRLVPRPVPADLDGVLRFGRALLGARRQVLRRTLPRAYEAVGRCAPDAAALSAVTAALGLRGDERADVLTAEQISGLFAAGRPAVLG